MGRSFPGGRNKAKGPVDDDVNAKCDVTLGSSGLRNVTTCVKDGVEVKKS